MSSVDRFLAAQDSPYSGYASALEEIRAGRKQGHWIWYVFPQLRGLGTSDAAINYGIGDADEAAAYLGHPVLRSRLYEITAAVVEQLRGGARLALLMGSEIDALKLVSSMTLFGSVAAELAGREHNPEHEAFASLARELLALASDQGYPACEFTRRRLAAAP